MYHILRFSPLLLQCRTPYAVIHGLVLLLMGIMMPETCWDRSFIINIGLVATRWFIVLCAHSLRHSCTQPQPAQPVQNTICSNTRSCFPDDGHKDARNVLRLKFDNIYRISCILLVSLSSSYVHDARSQEPKISTLPNLYLSNNYV